jgi:hypothetical protein
MNREFEATPEEIISELSYGCYAFNRDKGMSASRLLRLFPETGIAMEIRYTKEVQHAQSK